MSLAPRWDHFPGRQLPMSAHAGSSALSQLCDGQGQSGPHSHRVLIESAGKKRAGWRADWMHQRRRREGTAPIQNEGWPENVATPQSGAMLLIVQPSAQVSPAHRRMLPGSFRFCLAAMGCWIQAATFESPPRLPALRAGKKKQAAGAIVGAESVAPKRAQTLAPARVPASFQHVFSVTVTYDCSMNIQVLQYIYVL